MYSKGTYIVCRLGMHARSLALRLISSPIYQIIMVHLKPFKTAFYIFTEQYNFK
jgi:hypothetical protein